MDLIGQPDPAYAVDPAKQEHPDSDLILLVSNTGVLMDWPAAYTPNSGAMDTFMLVQTKGKESIFEYVAQLRQQLNERFPDVESSPLSDGRQKARNYKGITFRMMGEVQSMRESIKQFTGGLIIASILVYLVSCRVTLAALMCLWLVTATGCDQLRAVDKGAQAAGGAAPPSQVDVVAIQQDNLALTVELPASVQGQEMAELMPRIDGYVEEVLADIGQSVTKGQVLATLDVQELSGEIERKQQLVKQADAEIAISQAQVTLAQARQEEQQAVLDMRKVELERISSLVERGALNRQNLDEAQFAVTASNAALTRAAAEVTAAEAEVVASQAHRDVAAAEQKIAETMAGYRDIKAPFDGLITARSVDPGAFVRPATTGSGTSLFRITRVDKVRVILYISMDMAEHLGNGDPVVLENLEALPGKRIDGIGGKPLVISRSAGAFQKGSRMMRAEIDIDNNELQEALGSQLKPGDYGMARLTLKTWENALTVPRASVGKKKDGESYIVKLDGKNTCREIPVQVVFEDEDRAAIVAHDIQAGDRVVAKALDRIATGETLTAERVHVVDPAIRK